MAEDVMGRQQGTEYLGYHVDWPRRVLMELMSEQVFDAWLPRA